MKFVIHHADKLTRKLKAAGTWHVGMKRVIAGIKVHFDGTSRTITPQNGNFRGSAPETSETDFPFPEEVRSWRGGKFRPMIFQAGRGGSFLIRTGNCSAGLGIIDKLGRTNVNSVLFAFQIPAFSGRS